MVIDSRLTVNEVDIECLHPESSAQKMPYVFLAPDLHSDQLREFALALADLNLKVFRLLPKEPLMSEDVKRLYQFFSDEAEALKIPILYVGFENSGNDFVANYYNYNKTHMPSGAILLSCAPTLHDLNNLTCPFFLIYGKNDPSLNPEQLGELSAAVHHHQMRYGDATTQLAIPNLPKQYNDTRFLDQVVPEVRFWLQELNLF